MSELITTQDVRESNSMASCFAVSNYDDAQRVAKTLAASELVPDIYQSNKKGVQAIANCLIALDMAMRLKMSPLMVMQNMYPVHGRPSWSAAFLVAAINKSGLFKTPIRYKIDGEGDDWGCVAWAIDNEGERLESTRITMGMAKSEGWTTRNGSKWKTMPEQMLRYRAATFFCRAYCPEIAMGMQTADEVIDITPEPETQNTQETQNSKTTADIVREAVKNKIKPKAEPKEEHAEVETIDEEVSVFEQAKRKIENAKTKAELEAASKWYLPLCSSGTGEIIMDEEEELVRLFNEKFGQLKK